MLWDIFVIIFAVTAVAWLYLVTLYKRDKKNYVEWKEEQKRGGDMPNEKNLIPFEKRTASEQREIRSAGGIASGVSRRRKKSLREAADLYLSLPPSDRRKWNKIARKGVDPEDIDNQMAMIIGLTDRAIDGDAKAAKVIIDLLGENPAHENFGADSEMDPLSRSLEELAKGLTSDDE